MGHSPRSFRRLSSLVTPALEAWLLKNVTHSRRQNIWHFLSWLQRQVLVQKTHRVLDPKTEQVLTKCQHIIYSKMCRRSPGSCRSLNATPSPNTKESGKSGSRHHCSNFVASKLHELSAHISTLYSRRLKTENDKARRALPSLNQISVRRSCALQVDLNQT